MIHGLKLVALAVVAQAVRGMARQQYPDQPWAVIAALAAAVIVVSVNAWVQLIPVALGALAGLVFCRFIAPGPALDLPVRYGAPAGPCSLYSRRSWCVCR